jgi:urease accessory protein
MAPQLPLMIWLSPAFPVGAFAYSHGLEWAHEAGDVHDAASLDVWLRDLLEHGAARNDAILLATAYRAVHDGAWDEVARIAELAAALATSRERHLETTAQGNAFIQAARAAWPCGACDELARVWRGDIAYPVALGVASAGHDLPLAATLDAFLAAFVGNLVSAAVRLGVVGQTDGQRLIAALLPLVEETARAAHDATLDDLGAAAFRSDLAALKHETQYTRLFRS